MAAIVKTAKTIRNNWKKSTFAALLLAYGYNFTKDKIESINFMRAYCQEAQKFGDAPLVIGAKPRHITVILNPAAKNGKSKKLFEKYAAPLFYLAGIKVSVIQTEHEGQAKGLMEVMDNTDAVVVAGGDGTISDVITGLFRRLDGDSAARRFPVGIIPLGQTNTVAKNLFEKERSSEVRWIASAAMAVIKERYEPMDVMQIKSDSGKPVFALAKIDWGIFRDVQAKIPKYWYWGPLKSQIAFALSSLRQWPPSGEIKLSYISPCSGCSKCFEPVKNEPVIKENTRWWHAFIRIKPPVKASETSSKIDYNSITNEECGVWKNKQAKATSITVATKHAFSLSGNNWTDSQLQIRIVPDDLSRGQYVTEGLAYVNDGKASDDISECLEAKEIQLDPVVNGTDDSWYSIDNEEFEMRPIKIKLMPKKVNFYCQKD